jgi:hypothetical protein
MSGANESSERAARAPAFTRPSSPGRRHSAAAIDDATANDEKRKETVYDAL